MDAEEYLILIVEPTISELKKNPASLRYAFLSCVVAFHTIDYLSHPDKPQKLRNKFRDESAEFATIDRVAHAFKHVEAGHVRAKNNPLLSIDDVIERPAGIWDQAVWDLSKWDDSTGGVTINQERDFDLLDALNKTVEFLRLQIRK